jgi:hypothetical protein
MNLSTIYHTWYLIVSIKKNKKNYSNYYNHYNCSREKMEEKWKGGRVRHTLNVRGDFPRKVWVQPFHPSKKLPKCE